MLLAVLAEVPVRVALALALASSTTGVDLDYLTKTAKRESDYRTQATSQTSSATGLFQFIESTWLRMVKEEGPAFGLQDEAEKIFVTRSGKYYVPVAGDRKRILALRKDAHVASLMAAAYTRRNSQRLRDALGRTANGAELYMAHFLGPGDAIRLVEMTATAGNAIAAVHFPSAAWANQPIFFHESEKLTVSQVYQLLDAIHHGQDLTSARAQIVAGTFATQRSAYSRHVRTPLTGMPSGEIGAWTTTASDAVGNAIPLVFRGTAPATAGGDDEVRRSVQQPPAGYVARWERRLWSDSER